MSAHRSTPSLSAPWVIAIILIVASLHWLRVLAVPVAFALFLMALVWPVYGPNALRGGAARALAIAAAVLLVLIAALAVFTLAGYAASTVADGVLRYGARMQELYHAIGSWLEQKGIAYWPPLADQFSPRALFHLVHQAASHLNAVIAFLGLTLIFLIMGLLEVSAFRRRLPHVLGPATAEQMLIAFEELAWKFRRYMLVRSAVSALTGLLTWTFAVLVGLDLAVAWGALAGALNYIPFVGSILAVLPPVIFAVIQFEAWQQPVLVLAGMATIQFSIGNLLDPRLEGRALALSPFAVIFSIFFWGLVWGVPGAFMGVPLTIALVTVCSRFEETAWITRMLTPGPVPERIKDEE